MKNTLKTTLLAVALFTYSSTFAQNPTTPSKSHNVKVDSSKSQKLVQILSKKDTSRVILKLNGTEWRPLGPTGLRRKPDGSLVATGVINSF
jgi:hypothetical protein